jgi:hypothetical protein
MLGDDVLMEFSAPVIVVPGGKWRAVLPGWTEYITQKQKSHAVS